ncbi:hypothetical protein B7P43_G00525 [Cryptotermes secundus]|uniref:Tc1-like transposase DDE domain-containing protein n=1 Tax=Cryptotermes secundus TaxID=105785 RepID=A0A2J7R694_9NEOP|nr:hypothetical protein B7P43_G00525 [Cryptotermes secundus]
MSDEAHFHSSGFVNKQNFHYWSATNPKELYETPLYSSEVTVWQIFADELRRQLGKSCNCDWTTLRSHVESMLVLALVRFPVKEETFFQQDGATCHTTRASMADVNNLFPDHVISRYGDIIWPAWSPDLSTCDFVLWGYLKSQVFKAPTPHTVQELNIEFGKKFNEFP